MNIVNNSGYKLSLQIIGDASNGSARLESIVIESATQHGPDEDYQEGDRWRLLEGLLGECEWAGRIWTDVEVCPICFAVKDGLPATGKDAKQEPLTHRQDCRLKEALGPRTVIPGIHGHSHTLGIHGELTCGCQWDGKTLVPGITGGQK